MRVPPPAQQNSHRAAEYASGPRSSTITLPSAPMTKRRTWVGTRVPGEEFVTPAGSVIVLVFRRPPARRALGRAETRAAGRAVPRHVEEDRRTPLDTVAVPADTEDLVNECLKISGTKAAFIAIEQPTKSVKISFRSRVGLNVAAIAERFGGGGHKQAAGAILPGPVPTAIAQVLTAIKAALAT